MDKHHGSCRPGRKKVGLKSMSSNAGGGGIERVVALGGALAVASLIAVLSIKKSSKKDSNKDTTNMAANDSCAKEEDAGEGLRFIPQDSSLTLHQNSCCTNHGTSKIGITEIETSELVSTQSVITLEENTIECERKDSASGQQETLVHDAEQESNAMTGNYGDIEKLSRPAGDDENSPMNGVENEMNDTLEMETIEIAIEDEAVDVDAEQTTAEEKSTLQSSLSSKEEEKSSISTGAEDEEEEEEEEEHLLMLASFPAEEEEEEEEEGEEEEEYSPIRSSFSMEDDGIDEEEKEDEEYSPKESSLSTEEEKDSALQSPFSTEEDENGENLPGMEEESSEGTWSSSPEPNMEVIWPAEIMGVFSPETKEMNVSHLESVMKSKEEDKTAKIETYNSLAKTTFDKGDNNNGKNNEETQELVVMDVRKEHSAKRQIWVWLGLVLLLLVLLANCLLQSNSLSNSVSIVFPMK